MTIFDEMGRQAEDARQSFARNGEVAARLAEAARKSGRLILLGMGGSHAVNRVAELLYREGRDRRDGAVVSEALHAPVPTARRNGARSRRNRASPAKSSLI